MSEHTTPRNLDLPPIPSSKDIYYGVDTQYQVYPVADFFNGRHGLRDTFLIDGEGSKFYAALKNPEIQIAAYKIGEFVASTDNSLSRLKFPTVRSEVIEGQHVALVEYFEGYEELSDLEEGKELLSANEKAFLGVYSAFIGNHDMKAEHVLVSSEREQQFGLIDMDLAFRFDDPQGNFLPKIKSCLNELGQDPPKDLIAYYCSTFTKLTADQLLGIVAGSGPQGERAAETALGRAKDGTFAGLLGQIYDIDLTRKITLLQRLGYRAI